MARIVDGSITGAVGNLVFYTMNGQKYARTKPGPRPKRRNQPQDPRTTVFGIVSRSGSNMISTMKDHFLFPFKLVTYNTLRGWMRNQYAAHQQDEVWELAAKWGSMCQINQAADMTGRIKVDIRVTDTGNGKIKVTFDEMNPVKDLKVPLRTKAVNIKLVAVATPFSKDYGPVYVSMEQYTVKYTDSLLPAKEIVLDTKGTAGAIAVVVAAIEYNTEGAQNNSYNRELHNLPAAVIAMGKLLPV